MAASTSATSGGTRSWPPAITTWISSLVKRTSLGHGAALQVRLDAFNIFNHVNFANPLLPNFGVDFLQNGIDPATNRGVGYLPLTATPDVGGGNPFLGRRRTQKPAALRTRDVLRAADGRARVPEAASRGGAARLRVHRVSYPHDLRQRRSVPSRHQLAAYPRRIAPPRTRGRDGRPRADHGTRPSAARRVREGFTPPRSSSGRSCRSSCALPCIRTCTTRSGT